jgi:nicotinamide-nucleotide amidase
MVEQCVLPLIRRERNIVPVRSRHLKAAGEAESKVDARVEPIYKNYPNVETTILSSPGIVSLHFTWRGDPFSKEAETVLDELVNHIEAELGHSVFTHSEESLAAVLGNRLRARSLTLATAESCTGGWIGKLLTDVSGSSEFFRGGVVSYSDEAKRDLLGVRASDLEQYGAVSEVVAGQMAAGVRSRFQADVGLSVTGIAGPEGGRPEKPVGTVYLGLSLARGDQTRSLFLPGGREAVRLRTCHLALDWVRREIT